MCCVCVALQDFFFLCEHNNYLETALPDKMFEQKVQSCGTLHLKATCYNIVLHKATYYITLLLFVEAFYIYFFHKERLVQNDTTMPCQ